MSTELSKSSAAYKVHAVQLHELVKPESWLKRRCRMLISSLRVNISPFWPHPDETGDWLYRQPSSGHAPRHGTTVSDTFTSNTHIAVQHHSHAQIARSTPRWTTPTVCSTSRKRQKLRSATGSGSRTDFARPSEQPCQPSERATPATGAVIASHGQQGLGLTGPPTHGHRNGEETRAPGRTAPRPTIVSSRSRERSSIALKSRADMARVGRVYIVERVVERRQ